MLLHDLKHTPPAVTSPASSLRLLTLGTTCPNMTQKEALFAKMGDIWLQCEP